MKDRHKGGKVLRVREETLERLNKLRKYGKTYDEIIGTLLDGAETSPDAKRGWLKSLLDKIFKRG